MLEFNQKYSVLCLGILWLMAPVTHAQEDHAETLSRYLTNDVVGVVYIDLDRLELDKTIETAVKLGFRDQNELADLMEFAPILKTQIGELKRAGVARVYGLLRTADIQTLGTSWLIPLKQGADVKSAEKAFSKFASSNQLPFFPQIGTGENVVLAAMTESQLQQLQRPVTAKRELSAEMRQTANAGAFGVWLFGDRDSRRVVRELMPQLQPPLDLVTGELIADGVQWATVELTLGANPKLEITIESENEKTVEVLNSVLKTAVNYLKQIPGTEKFLPKSEFEFVFGALTPKRVGNRLTISTAAISSDMKRLAKVLEPQVMVARQEVAKNNKLNILRQLALATHNHESAYKRFPTQALVDEQGKPLLSWRVQILPFLGASELYEQFHLDEPWDSEHNLKLIAKMPDVFKDPAPKARPNNKAGKTIFLAPAGKGLVFNGGEEMSFGDLKDGSSNTIMFVALAQAHAVPWTKPVDWAVDLENVKRELTEEGRTEFEFVLFDGSVQRTSLDIDETTLRNLIQPSDGNIVQGF